MKQLLDSFWRAGAYCLHPKVIGLSLLPLLIGIAIALVLGWFYWEAAVAGVRATLENWLLVSPRFHRLHHAVGLGHESAGQGSLGGHNFAVLFPVWDILFRSARFDDPLQPTGIRDQLDGRDYGRGFWAQQWLGLKRLAGKA